MEIQSYQKKGKTYYRFTFYVGMVNGKRKYIKRANFKSKKEARTALLLLQEEIDTPKSDMLFKDLTEKWLLEIIKGSGLEPITIHCFRHTHTNLISDAGMTLKQAQYCLGHSDIKTTMNVYTHITQKAIDDIGSKFSQYLDF